MLTVPFSGCEFYVADTIPRSSDKKTALFRNLDYTTNYIPKKAAVRPQIINNAVGFVNRFQAFIDNYLVPRLLAPVKAMSADSSVKGSLGQQLADLETKEGSLREFLDNKDTEMVATVDSAWQQDKAIIAATAQQAAGVLAKAETVGPQMITQEMKAMVGVANQAVRTNTGVIKSLANAQILNANSSARAVQREATTLLQATNQTVNRANTIFTSLNKTDANLASAQSNLNALLAGMKNDVIAKAQAEVLSAQNSASDAQLKASSDVDTDLLKVVQAVSSSLQSLTAEETTNLTALQSALDTDVNAFTSQINSNSADANRGAQNLRTTYDQNVSATMNDAGQLFQEIDKSMSASVSSQNAANATMQALKSFMDTQFSDVDNQLTALFNQQAQQAQLQQASLSSMMDSKLASLKTEALNATTQGSASLKAAYDSAIQTIMSGSDSLNLSFEQRQKIVAALSNWQQSYQGNTNQLVNSFGSTFSGLIKDTNAALTGAVNEQAAQLSALSDSQKQLMEDAIKAAHGDPTKLAQVLAQFGIVGDRAAAAAQQIAQNMQTSAGAISGGVNEGVQALTLIQDAARATSDTYKQAAEMNSQATATAQEAVKNVTTRLGTMNAVMQQYATQLSQELFGATSEAKQQIEAAATNNSQQLSEELQAKMKSVREMLTTALSKGKMSAADLSNFAAQVGANATALTNLVNALQSDSSSGLSAITSAKTGAIDSLKSQVKSQIAAAEKDFNSQVGTQQTALSGLIEGLRADLVSQSGSKSALLVQQRDLLQSLFGSMTSSSIEREHASSDMQQKLRDAEAKAASGLSELSGLIAAQKSRVMTAFNEKSQTMKEASKSVNATIADTNKSANAILSDIQNKGNDKVATIQKSLSDSAKAIDVMVSKYHAQVSAAMEQDRRERQKMEIDELSRVESVQAAYKKSAEDQYQATVMRQVQAQARAKALAEMIGSLSGAAAAAAQGDQAFQDYVKALAASTNTNMGMLVEYMRANISSGNSQLRDMLAKNSIFATGVLNELSQDAALLGQGAVDGGNGVLSTLYTSRLNSQGLAGQQAAVFNGVNDQNRDMKQLTNSQLVQLMTVFLAQSSLQDSSFAQANAETLNAIASLGDAMDLALSTMDAISNTTEDALELATSETGEAQVEVDEATNAVIDYATGAAANITDEAQASYDKIKRALDTATSFTAAFRERLTNDEAAFNKATPDFDTQLSKLKADVAGLSKTLDSNKQGAVDRVNQWAMSMEQDALNQLSRMQVQATR